MGRPGNAAPFLGYLLMAFHEIHRQLMIPRPLPDVFKFFARAENLEQITPPWLRFRIVSAPAEMRRGALITYALRVRGIPMRWLTEIEEWDPPHGFVDVQLKGPYKFWRHAHRFSAVDGGTLVEDSVRYALPFGLLGEAVHRLQVRRDISRIFDYRTERIRALLSAGTFV